MEALLRSRLRRIVAVFVVLWTALAEDALAYVDPGSGSLVLQLLFGGLVGALAIVRLYWNRLRAWWLGGRRGNRADDGDERGRPS